MILDESVLKEKIKTSSIGGAYIFCGEEDYLKRYYLAELRRIACPEEAFSVFNHAVFDGEDVDLAEISEAIKSPPMMGDFKLIEWKYPDLEHMKEKEKAALADLARECAEYPYAVLVLYASAEGLDPGSTKRPSKLAVALGADFSLFNFEKSTDAKLVVWLKRHFDAQGVACAPAVISALIFRSGHSMQVLKNELDKLCAYAKANALDKITEAEVEAIASSTVECDTFALSNAITDKDRQKAFLALADLSFRRVDPGAVLASIGRSVSDIYTVACFLDEGLGALDIESALGWRSGKVKIYINSAKRWGKERLGRALGRIRDLDSQSKFGGISGMMPIETFLCEYL